jgi:hypothetical protein
LYAHLDGRIVTELHRLLDMLSEDAVFEEAFPE